MTNIDGMLKREIKASDAVVDGLFRGVLAGLGMGVYLAIGQPLVGLLAHLAVSGIYGALFGLLSLLVLRRAGLPGWTPLALGGVYGLLLFAVAWFALLPGVDSPLLGIPPLHFGLGHLLYGLALGWLVRRSMP